MAVTAALETGFPPTVELISPGASAAKTSLRAATAAVGMPLPMPLPMATMSGVRFSHSIAHILPVRP